MEAGFGREMESLRWVMEEISTVFAQELQKSWGEKSSRAGVPKRLIGADEDQMNISSS